MPKELGLFYVALITFKLYIQRDQFIILQANLQIPSHQMPSNFMLVFKRLHMNLLNILPFLTLKVVIGYHPTRLKNTDYLHINFFKFNSQRNRNIIFQTVHALSKQNPSHIMHQRFYHIYITRLKLMTRKGLMEGIPINIPDLE